MNRENLRVNTCTLSSTDLEQDNGMIITTLVGISVHVTCNFHACLKKHACHSIVSIVLYACHM